MPATVRISPSARTGLRALLVVAAVIALLIPIAFSVAHGASRLNYTRIETSETLPAAVRDIRFDLDTGAAVVVRTADVTTPEVTLSGVGPRDDVPQLRVEENEGHSVIAVDDTRLFEKSRIELAVPETTSQETNLDFSGGLGEIDVTGTFNEVEAATDAGSISLDGDFAQVQATTDWGRTDLQGTFGTVEVKSGVGTIDGADLQVSDRLDATTSAGSIDLDFSNEAVPASGIAVTADTGQIGLRLPRLDLVKEKRDAAAGDDAEVKELFYRINAKSNQGTVDLAKELDQYDASKDPDDAEGKAIIPVSVTADTGEITIKQN